LVADKLKKQWFQGLVSETNCILIISLTILWNICKVTTTIHVKVAMETLMTADDSLTDVYLVVKMVVVSLLRKSEPVF